MGIVYLAALLVSLAGMVVLDRRFRLFYWANARRASAVHVAGIVFFLVWDIYGISQGIFFRGETSFMTGILLGPELPLEELFFLTLLTYMTMNLFGASNQLMAWFALRSPGQGIAPGSAETDTLR